MAKYTDANGKVFDVEIKDFCDMAIDSGLPISEVKNSVKNIVTITDENGNAINFTELMDSIKEDKANIPKAIDVTFEATHSGRNKNKEIYHSDSMQEDMTSWMTPFAKPFIKNHDMYEDPIGRAVRFSFGQSTLNYERDTILYLLHSLS